MATKAGKFLTQDERDLCEKIAALNMVLVSRRAQTLLLLDDGHTLAKSCELSSLTFGQVRYLIRVFRKKRMNLFPEDLFLQMEQKESEKTAFSEPETEPAIPDNDVKIEKKKKKKKKSAAKEEKQSKKEKKKKNTQSKKKGKKKKRKLES